MSRLSQEGVACQLAPGKSSDRTKDTESDNSSPEKSQKPKRPDRPPPPGQIKSPCRQPPSPRFPPTTPQRQQPKQQTSSMSPVGQAVQAGILASDIDRFFGTTDTLKEKEQVKQTEQICGTISKRSSTGNTATLVSPSSSPKPPIPAPRHSRDFITDKDTTLLGNSTSSDLSEKEHLSSNVSSLYTPVNKPRKSVEDSTKKVLFSSGDSPLRGHISKKDPISRITGERRRTVAGHETEGAKEGKPVPPEKPDHVKRHFSLKTSKELELQQFQQNFSDDNGAEGERKSSIDLTRNLVLENTNIDALTPSVLPVRSSSFSVASRTLPSHNIVPKAVAPPKPFHKKHHLRQHMSEGKDGVSVTQRSDVTQRSASLPETTISHSPLHTISVPPPKPPRTHAHDDYLKVQSATSQEVSTKPSPEIKNQAAARRSEGTLNTSFRGGECYKDPKSPSLKHKLSKKNQPIESSSFPTSSKQNSTDSNSPPSRPPPPKRRSASDDRPVLSSYMPCSPSENPKGPDGGPVATPFSSHSQKHLGKKPLNFPELHSRHPQDKLPPRPIDRTLRRLHLQKSFSSECLHSGQDIAFKEGLHVDDDSDSTMSRSSCGSLYTAVIDPDGYAVPNAFMRLPGQQKKSVPNDNIIISPKRFLRRTPRCSDDPAVPAKNIRVQELVITTVQEQNLDKVNKKTMIMVRQKINQAYADVNVPLEASSDRPESDWEFVHHGPEADEFSVESTVLKRIEYCTSVRRRSVTCLRRSKDFNSAIYPQLFEYCLVVGLRPLIGEEGYEAYIMHKFPENVSCNLSIPSFCFPDATIFKPGTATAISESYSFAMTSSDGSRAYGYCRRIQPRDNSLPEVVCIVSPVDAFNMYNTLLGEIETRRNISFDLASELIAASFGRPLPQPGKVCHIRTLDSGGDMETIYLNRLPDSRLENVNYESPLHYLGTDKLVKVFSSMLMERRIILYSSNLSFYRSAQQSDREICHLYEHHSMQEVFVRAKQFLFYAYLLSILTQTVHALCALLYPFCWQHVYVPILPGEMLDAVCAPMPFIVGVLSCFLPRVQEMDLEEVMIIDLDKKLIVKSQGDESTILPKRVQKALKTAINMCKIDAEAHKSQWLMVTEAFLRMFIETVGHFANHIFTQQDGNKIFQKEGFILEAASKERREFLQWFTETQMFEVFIVNHVDKSDSKSHDLFMQRLTEFKDAKEESGRQKGLEAKVKNFGKALKTVLQAS